jgi:hypothetical protein
VHLGLVGLGGHGCQAVLQAARSASTISPFQPMVPSKSTSMRTISGGLGGAALLGTGMFILTACVWIGIVMMNMISSTSITSISGVVLMSTITSSSLALPTFIPPFGVLLRRAASAGGGSVMKPDLGDAARWQATTRRPTDS